MADWRSLAEVAVQPMPGRAFVSAGEASADHARFHADVLRWQAAFSRNAGNRWALHFDDAARFAAALYGAWHAGKTVLLPGDALTGTQARLRAHVDGFAGDWPEADLPSPDEAKGTDAVPIPLDVDWWCSPPAAPENRWPSRSGFASSMPRCTPSKPRSAQAWTA
jgi:hypothetical protein